MTDKKKENLILALTLAVIIVLIPAVYVLASFLGDRHLYIASVIIMILAMVPFFVKFEAGKPDARVLAILAVMTVIAVVSRVAFIWAPGFKPMAGVIIITAIGFGPQAGFMCGALSMIASNIIFGQGPWTPWQMFCYGMIGFIAGLLGRSRIMSEKHAIRSAVISFILVFILSGLVLDTCSVFFVTSALTPASVLAVYIAGIPFNIGNAAASAVCVFLLVKPLAAAFARIKVKYGIRF